MNNIIKATKVTINNRFSFLSKYFGSSANEAESTLYEFIADTCGDYTDAHWCFYELSNGGFYLAPNLFYPIGMTVIRNYFDEFISADAAGIIATLFVLRGLCFTTKSDYILEMYYCLLDFAGEHEEASKILAAID